MKEEIQHLTVYKGFQIDVLRLDLLHPFYGGNKYFKLKYNIEKAGPRTILTFGGAHSNHIYSTAAYCHELKMKCVGVIRGEENSIENSPTLQFAKQHGMHLHFVSREKYRYKKALHEELRNEFGDFYLIPEGGNNAEGIKGCSEILNDVPFYDYIFCACGTACTYMGILSSAKKGQKIIGISVLKGENRMIYEVNANAGKFSFEKIKEYASGIIESSTIIDDFHFGGYAKHTRELLNFKRNFENEHKIPLDYVYTAKLFYAVFDLINKEFLKQNSRVLIVHSGGLQGNYAYEKRYGMTQ